MTPRDVGVDPRLGTGPQADLTDGGSLDFDEDTTGSSYAMTDREAGFLRSFRAAVRESKRDSEGENGQEQQTPEPRVLATAEQPRWTGLPTPADAAPAPAAASSTDEIVNAVTDAIDRSIRADMAPRDGAPLRLALTFPQEGLGLTGLYITLTPTTLDVIFERTGPELPEALVRAAEALAARLLTRQSKKTVRILDIEKRPDAANREPEAPPPPLSLFL
ncbi:hypothetical protein [Bradyrhizobium sp. Y36]|uniref:hypothetical protein n=1 Tax=Bradyrhizobium sp. Y36 TaxID=2035447 RepID=UPI001177C317|nr:hypothetical protein [Bradyrhizobium sp. Y36]